MFEQAQRIKIEICDSNDKEKSCIGSVEFMLHEILQSENHMLKLKLMDNENENENEIGKIIIQGDQIDTKLSSNMASLTIDASSIISMKKHFYKLLTLDKEDQFLPVYQSEVVHGYKWKRIRIPTADLFHDEDMRIIKIEIYEYSSKGDHALLCKNEVTFRQLLKDYKWISPIGEVMFKEVSLENRHSFLDYIFGGCQISLSIAIDFSGL